MIQIESGGTISTTQVVMARRKIKKNDQPQY